MKEEYRTFSAEQLASEPAFIDWVMKGETDSDWQRWISEHPDRIEVVTIARQMVTDLNQTVIHVWKDSDRHEVWQQIDRKISGSPEKPQKPIYLRWWTAGLAAAAAIALFFWLTGTSDQLSIVAEIGEQKEVTLPDQSVVHLNAGSTLRYDAASFAQKRLLSLEGEAFFAVKPGSSFIVKTDQGNITVLGTSFNVFSREDRFEVSCFTGKVMVDNHHASETLLQKGEKCKTNPESHTLERSTFEVNTQTPSWTVGKFVFDGQTLREVADELERQYHVKVNMTSDLENLTYVGVFESGDLEKALSLITWPLHLKASIQKNEVLITR